MTETVPFLTEIDARAEVKGSRDPLGLVPIWSHFGRRVVGDPTAEPSWSRQNRGWLHGCPKRRACKRP